MYIDFRGRGQTDDVIYYLLSINLSSNPFIPPSLTML
jgi:hypothetical protein